MLIRRQWPDITAARTVVFIAAGLALAASAVAGWRLMGARETDPFSEAAAVTEARSIADGHQKYGIVSYVNFPNGPIYALVPFIKLGAGDISDLRRVPFVFGLLCEGLLLAAIVVLRASTARRLWLILAIGTIYLQPGVAGWLGGLHEHSFVLSCTFAMLAAAITLRERFLPAVFALMFLAGWLGYDFVPAQFFGVLALRWLVHCRDASDGDLAGPFRRTALDGLVAGSALLLAILTHYLQNVLFFGSFAVAFRSLAGSAAARMSLNVGATLDPTYYKHVKDGAQLYGNPRRLDILLKYLNAFSSAQWTYPSQFALLGVGSVAAAAISWRRPSIPSDFVRLGVFFVCVFFCVDAWILLMPWHAANHPHFFPRHFFVPSSVLVLASVMLPDSLPRRARSPHRAGASNAWAPDVVALRPFLSSAGCVLGTLGIFFAILNAASLWRVAPGSTLRWRIFTFFGALMSAWALGVRLKWRPKIAASARLSTAVAIVAACSSAYGLYFVGAEILSSRASWFTALSILATAAAVIGSHEHERKSAGLDRPRAVAALVALAVLLVCGVAWIETGRLMYWGSFSDWASGELILSVKTILLCGLVPLLLLWDLPSAGLRRKGLLALDVLAVLILFLFAFEKDLLLIGGGDFNYPVFIAPVDYIRSGGHLLWDIPSQYGFLNILLVAALKPLKSAQAFYLVNSTLIFLGALISYGAFRLAWPTVGAPLVGIPFIVGSSFFLPGMAPWMYSPQLYPSDGPFRYLICYLLLLLLLLQQLPGWKERLPARRVMRLGTCLWLVGCFWSAESLAYCTAIWFPALLLLDGWARREDAAESPGSSFVNSAKLLRLPAILLGGAVAILSLYYLLRIGHFPDFRGYYDYALSFKGGFGANAETPGLGERWLVLFFFSSFLILAFSVKPEQRPLAAAALFSSWAVSSYYAALSHPHSLLNLFPIFVLALNILIFVLRNTPVRGEWDLFARSLVRALAFTLIPFMIMVYFHDLPTIEQKALASFRALGKPFSTPSQLRWNGEPEPVTPFIDQYDRDMRAAYVALLSKEFDPVRARCVISLQDYWQNDAPQQELWVPFLSTAMVWALPLDVRLKYWDRFMARIGASSPSEKCPERWLAYHDNTFVPVAYYSADPLLIDSQWKLKYLEGKSMRIERRIDEGSWHLVKMSSVEPVAKNPLP